MECQFHHSPIIKIQSNSKRLLCQKCLQETPLQKKNRIQQLRLKLQNNYQLEIKQIQSQKLKIDKLFDIFVNKNMSDAKKIINKASNNAQKQIQSILQKQISIANKILLQYSDQLLRKYRNLDIKNISQVHLDFDLQRPIIQKSMEQKKNELKNQINAKIKKGMRKFYQALFQF